MGAYYGYTKSTNDCCASWGYGHVKLAELCNVLLKGEDRTSIFSKASVTPPTDYSFRFNATLFQFFKRAFGDMHIPSWAWMDELYHEQHTVTCDVSDLCAAYTWLHIEDGQLFVWELWTCSMLMLISCSLVYCNACLNPLELTYISKNFPESSAVWPRFEGKWDVLVFLAQLLCYSFCISTSYLYFIENWNIYTLVIKL